MGSGKHATVRGVAGRVDLIFSQSTMHPELPRLPFDYINSSIPIFGLSIIATWCVWVAMSIGIFMYNSACILSHLTALPNTFEDLAFSAKMRFTI